MKFKIISKIKEMDNKKKNKKDDSFLFSSKTAAKFQEKLNTEMDNYRRELSKKAIASEQEAETIVLTS